LNKTRALLKYLIIHTYLNLWSTLWEIDGISLHTFINTVDGRHFQKIGGEHWTSLKMVGVMHDTPFQKIGGEHWTSLEIVGVMHDTHFQEIGGEHWTSLEMVGVMHDTHFQKIGGEHWTSLEMVGVMHDTPFQRIRKPDSINHLSVIACCRTSDKVNNATPLLNMTLVL